jgi:predicted nucleic acid-binding protein
MAVVVDASTLLSLAFDDEGVPYGSALITSLRDAPGLAPAILWYELRNALVVSERRGRITAERTESFLALVDMLPIVVQPLPASPSVMDLARRLRLSVYDASYLELAVHHGASLATLDDALREAARTIKVRHWMPADGGPSA